MSDTAHELKYHITTVRLLENAYGPASDRVFQIAWNLAGQVRAKTQPSQTELDTLRQAVLGHRSYKRYTATSTEKYDGV